MRTLYAALGLLALSIAGSSRVAPPQDHVYRYHYENILGTSLEVKVQAGSEAAADTAHLNALDEIERLRAILSGYDSASEFSRWMKTRNQAVRVSTELFEVLGLFDQWRARTAGALNPAAEAITRVWKQAAARNRKPTASELADAVTVAGQSHWSLDPQAGTATHLTDAPVVLNSFAKSYIAGKAAAATLLAEGVSGAIVNIGGDLAIRGDITERVDIADPRSDAENAAPLATLSLRDRAIATSGNYRRGVEIDGRHYSHIVDPRTGLTADAVIGSTVVAPDAATAGALATAFSVMKRSDAERLAAATPGVEYLLVAANGHPSASPGWAALRVPAIAPLPAAAATTGPAWDTSMELTIQLELARITDFRARRPYLAAWIEDPDRFPVRTLALWYEKPRWLPELKAWFKDDRLRAMAEGTDIARSVSSATRPAGKYTLKWDGKDNSGKLVRPGKYNVLIEAAREHGTYQLIHQELDFNGAPRQVQAPAGTEIASASIEYRKAH